MRRFIGWALAALLGAASAQAQPVERDVAWLAGTAESPPGDIGRECLESTILSLTALADFRLAHAPDDAVRSAMVAAANDADELAMRQAEAELWAKTHDPASVAAEHLKRCLVQGGVTLKDAPSTHDCLEAVTPVVARKADEAEVHAQAQGLAFCLQAGAGAGRARMAHAKTSCAVVLGGGGTDTGDSDLNDKWFKVDSTISNAAASELAAKSYNVRPLMIDTRAADERFGALWSELSAAHCTKAVQISYTLRGQIGSDRPDALSIQVDVFHFTVHADGTATPSSEYTKSYDSALTAEALEKLSVLDVASRIAADLAAAGVLPKG